MIKNDSNVITIMFVFLAPYKFSDYHCRASACRALYYFGKSVRPSVTAGP